MFLKNWFAAVAAAVVLGVGGAGAYAAQPRPWQIGLQDAASPVMAEMAAFHNMLLVIITVITLFVLGLMVYVMVRFRASRNPTPSRTAHNTVLEVLWTVIPILILLFIAIPSFRLLYYQNVTPDSEMTLKVIGHQWYWTYEYPDHGGLTFDSFLACRTAEECEAMGAETGVTPVRLLDTDNRVVLPVDTTVRVLMTADDVIHSWAVPALGIKTDTVPGRLNEAWLRIEGEGLYYGQCSELCGLDHGYMPIAIEAVSREAFEDWVETAREEFARKGGGEPALQVAQKGAAGAVSGGPNDERGSVSHD
jgi:cytochrome c oxidase subunit 2